MPSELQFWILATVTLLTALLLVSILLISVYHRQYRKDADKEFLNNFMHEFKTPLAVIRIAGKVLQTPGIEQQPVRLKKYAAIVKDQSAHLENNINRILEVAASGRNRLEFAKEEIELNRLTENAITFLQPLIDERRASVTFEASRLPTAIQGDPVYILQVIINLLDNALKYSEKPEVKVTLSNKEKNCILSVQDNGIGIEKKHLKQIFRKYYRVPTGNIHNVKGFGIGLNFAKEVVNAHNGTIEVESWPGKGSKFSIHMPLN